MESITKNRQPQDVLRAMVTRAYGADAVPDGEGWCEELGQGWFNVAYRIRLRDGRQVVLKIAPPAGVEVMTYERDLMANEVHALTLVRERTTVPVPAVHHHDTSHDLCDADWFFMEYVDAENLGVVRAELPPEQRRGYTEALGAVNRELNRIPGDHFGPLRSGSPERTWRQVFMGILEEVLQDGERRQVDIGRDYDLVRTLIEERADCLDEVTDPVFVEWDLWDGNVMIRDGAIVGIIDHERALYGDPLMESGFAPTELAAFGDPGPFLRGYGKAPLTPAERERRRLYNLHLMLIMVIETVFRGFAAPAHFDWTRARLDEVLAGFDPPR